VNRPDIADVLREGFRSGSSGRSAELSLLRQLATPGGPVAAYVHGPAGIGKTALLAALAANLDDDGIRNVRIQAGANEPNPAAIVMALGKAKWQRPSPSSRQC